MSQVLPLPTLEEVKVVPVQEICRDTWRANHLANKWIQMDVWQFSLANLSNW